MQTFCVNGYDMAYLEVGPATGKGSTLICVHGSLGDFRTWNSVLGPLSKSHRVISVSLRHFFPEHWDGEGDDYRIAQHVDDVIAFIERLNSTPVDLMGHSRGGHIAFRVAQQRPDLLRRLVLAEPGGDLDASLDPTPSTSISAGVAALAKMVEAGFIEGAIKKFFEAIDGDGAWARLSAAGRQQLRDNASTLIGQMHERRQPYTKADAQSIKTPTLFVGGGDSKGGPANYRALVPHVAGSQSAVIANTGHWMFEQAPQQYCRIVTDFLAN